MKVSINKKIWTGRQDTLHGLYTKGGIIYMGGGLIVMELLSAFLK